MIRGRGTAICLILLLADKKSRRDGIVLDLYLILYSIGRFFIEFFRGDDRGSTVVGFLTPSQLVSVLLVLTGLILLAVRIAKRSAHEGP